MKNRKVTIPNAWYHKLNAGEGCWAKSEDFVDEVTDVNAAIYCIYKTTNKVNGKCYIGFARDPERRWWSHTSSANNPASPEYTTKFKRAIRKYGDDAWNLQILFVSNCRDRALDKESASIHIENSSMSGYNTNSGGEGAFRSQLSEQFIADRAIEFFEENGQWPTERSGKVKNGYNKDTWAGYSSSLYNGTRGLPGGSSLPRLMAEMCKSPKRAFKEHITEDYIAEKAMSHYSMYGEWPNQYSGKVYDGIPGDSWSGYNSSLRSGNRGLSGGSSLAKLLDTRFGVFNRASRPDISNEFIIQKAVNFFESVGKWPTSVSGVVDDGFHGDTWGGYDQSLRLGLRGLPKGSSLSKILAPLKLSVKALAESSALP